jgi:hypothetical protein
VVVKEELQEVTQDHAKVFQLKVTEPEAVLRPAINT